MSWESKYLLLSQFFITQQGLSPLAAGIRILPWTAMPMFVAPIAGALSDRVGGQRLMALGLILQSAGLAWIATVTSRTVPYADLVGGFALSGAGMALFFAPVANVVLGSVRESEQGKASGATNAIRELGGVFGVAVLASIFAHQGGYAHFISGTTTAVYIGAAVVAVGALAALMIPAPRRARDARAAEPALEPATV